MNLEVLLGSRTGVPKDRIGGQQSTGLFPLAAEVVPVDLGSGVGFHWVGVIEIWVSLSRWRI